MENYCIVNANGKPLSQFVANDLSGKSQLLYRKQDIYSFRSIEEAERFINNIQRNGSQKTRIASMKLRVRDIH